MEAKFNPQVRQQHYMIEGVRFCLDITNTKGGSSLLSGYLPRAPAEDGEDMTHNIMWLDYHRPGFKNHRGLRTTH